jgi:hypothetical protein
VHRSEYYALITYLDQQLGRVLDALEKSGHAKDTVVFLTGDNGISVGQHGFMASRKCRAQHEVPLLARRPGHPERPAIDAPAICRHHAHSLELPGWPFRRTCSSRACCRSSAASGPRSTTPSTAPTCSCSAWCASAT